LTVTTGGGAEVSIGGSATSFKLSRDISIEAVDIWKTCCWFESGLRGLDTRLLGSDLSCSDLRDTGDMEPSRRLRLAGEAERPDMSRVRLETRAEVSLWAEFCLVRPDTGGWPPSPALPPLVEMLGADFGDSPRPCPMEMGLELRDLMDSAPSAAGAGLQDRDLRGVPGVPGGVTPLPLAREAPITLTSSLTETPWSSGGMSLL